MRHGKVNSAMNAENETTGYRELKYGKSPVQRNQPPIAPVANHLEEWIRCLDLS